MAPPAQSRLCARRPRRIRNELDDPLRRIQLYLPLFRPDHRQSIGLCPWKRQRLGTLGVRFNRRQQCGREWKCDRYGQSEWGAQREWGRLGGEQLEGGRMEEKRDGVGRGGFGGGFGVGGALSGLGMSAGRLVHSLRFLPRHTFRSTPWPT